MIPDFLPYWRQEIRCRQHRRHAVDGEIDLTVVSRENFHAFHGFVGEMITGRIGAGSMLSPVRRIFAPGRVHVAEIERIDLAARKVITRNASAKPISHRSMIALTAPTCSPADRTAIQGCCSTRPDKLSSGKSF